MKRTPWFERNFPPVEDNGLLQGILERLEGTPHRLRALLAGVERSSRIETGWWGILMISSLSGCSVLATSLRAADLTAADLSNRKTHDQITTSAHSQSTSAASSAIAWSSSPGCEKPQPMILGRASKHPRLGTPMHLIDLAFFVAAHDDHHLAKLRELKAHRGTSSPEL